MKTDERRDFEERIQSMQASLHDIDRWLMTALVNGRLSRDQCHDIEFHAKRLGEGAAKLYSAKVQVDHRSK